MAELKKQVLFKGTKEDESKSKLYSPEELIKELEEILEGSFDGILVTDAVAETAVYQRGRPD